MVVSLYLESECYFLTFINHQSNLRKSIAATHMFYFCRVGRNVAAGMTGGLAYILDEDDTLIPKVCADGLDLSFTVCSLLCWKFFHIYKEIFVLFKTSCN